MPARLVDEVEWENENENGENRKSFLSETMIS